MPADVQNTAASGEIGWEQKGIPEAWLYAKIVTNHPCKLILVTTIACLICAVIGAIVPDVPDFGEAKVGFEPRGTDYSMKAVARMQLQVYPLHRICADCEAGRSQQPPYPSQWVSCSCDICADAVGRFDAGAIAENDTGDEYTCQQASTQVSNCHVSCAEARSMWSGRCCSRRLGASSHEGNNTAAARRLGECDNPYSHVPFSNWQSEADIFNTIARCYGNPSYQGRKLYCFDTAFQLREYPAAVTLEHPDGEGGDISSVDKLRAVCKFSRQLKGSQAFIEYGRSNYHSGGMCPLFSLPETIMLLDALMSNSLAQGVGVVQGVTSCDDLSEDMLNRVFMRMEKCGKLLFDGTCQRGVSDGDLSCSTSSCNSTCQSDCNRNVNLLVNWIYTYLVPVDWRNPQHGGPYTSTLKGTNIFLIHQAWEDHHLMFELLMNQFSDWLGNDHDIKIAGVKIQGKFNMFNTQLITDAAFAFGACLFSVIILIVHTRSFTVSFVAAGQILGSLVLAYFLFRVVLNFKHFAFLNANMAFVAFAIGVDDVFVFMDAYKQSYIFLPSDCPMQNRISWTTARSFSAMLVTTVTTVVAFLANVVSPITTIKTFGVFAACVILADFFLMLTVLPAIVVFVETSCCKKLCVCGSCNRAMADQGQESRARFLERVFQVHLAPVITHKYGRFFFFVIFTAFGVFSLVHATKMQKSKAEELQLFVGRHPIEKYDQQWLDQFAFESERKSRRGMKIEFFAGIKASDEGDYFNPYDLGPLVFEEPGSLTSRAAQTYFLALCDSFPTAPLYETVFTCLYQEVRDLAVMSCGIEGADQTCCGHSYPMDEDIFDICLTRVLSIHHTSRFHNHVPLEWWDYKYMLDSNGKLKVVMMSCYTTQRYTSNVDIMQDFYDKVNPWAESLIDKVPGGVKKPFWISSGLGFWDLQKGMNDGAFMAVGVALIGCAIVLLIVIGNLVMAVLAVISIVLILGSVVATLHWFGWVLDLMVACVMAICVGLCVDFVCHMSHAYVYAADESKVPTSCSAQFCWRNADERALRASRALGVMGITVAMGALTTLGGGLVMLLAEVKFFFQFGTFLAVTMLYAFLYATIHFPAMASICGPVGHFGDLWNIYGKIFFCCRETCRKSIARISRQPRMPQDVRV